MKRYLFILLLPMVLVALADDYVDDLYYTEASALEQQLRSGELQPYYNKENMLPIVFIDDLPLPADTIEFITDTLAMN